MDVLGNPIPLVLINLKGLRTGVITNGNTDAEGFFEFTGLDADTYRITAKKKRYRQFSKKVELGAGEQKEVYVEMRKKGRR